VDGVIKNVPRILVSVVYTYAIIIQAAKVAQASERWRDDAKIQSLMFSSKWVRTFLNRANMRRRKITTDDKLIPSDEEIKRIMDIGQQIYKDYGHNKDTTINMDETAFTYAIGPEHMYCPPDQSRAQNLGVPNTKLRITAVVAVSGNGDFIPLFIIIKHSVSSADRPDQSGMRVIKDLHKKDDGYGVSDGWELILWSRSLNFKGVAEMHKCYYIINKRTGHVITSQFKAWNDTVRMIMWLDTIVKPLKEKLGKLMIWFDNCGCHKTSLVDDVIAELGIQIACLPPNMTGVLQVLDLVVNGPLKAHTRNLRGARIVESFQSFIKLYTEELDKDVSNRVLPVFEPPKPDMMQSIKDLFDLMADGFKLPKFVEGVKRSFISTGCVPIDESNNLDPKFKEYSKHKICGTMKIAPSGTSFPTDTSNTDISVNETHQYIMPIDYVLEYDNAMLEYDHEFTDAMNFITNL
jgi:hypothetical protein